MGETYLMHYDNDGNIKGYYPKSQLWRYQKEDLPTQFVEITEEEHQIYTNSQMYKLDIETLQVYRKPDPIVDPKDAIKAELRMLDDVLPRAMEDLINAIGLDITKLPLIMQERLARKIELRAQLNK